MKIAKINLETGEVLEVHGLEALRTDEELAEDERAAPESVAPRTHRWDGTGFVELPFKALQLDADGILEAIVTLERSAELTARHVDLRPLGGDCDREPGQYRWDGAQLVPLKVSALKRAPGGVSLEQAFAALLDQAERAGVKMNDTLMVWRAGYRSSLDAAKNKKGA
jgi:hypothetical protein